MLVIIDLKMNTEAVLKFLLTTLLGDISNVM